MKDLCLNEIVSWLIGNRVGTLPVARAYAQATAAADDPTAASPAPPGWSTSGSITMTSI